MIQQGNAVALFAWSSTLVPVRRGSALSGLLRLVQLLETCIEVLFETLQRGRFLFRDSHDTGTALAAALGFNFRPGDFQRIACQTN